MKLKDLVQAVSNKTHWQSQWHPSGRFWQSGHVFRSIRFSNRPPAFQNKRFLPDFQAHAGVGRRSLSDERRCAVTISALGTKLEIAGQIFGTICIQNAAPNKLRAIEKIFLEIGPRLVLG